MHNCNLPPTDIFIVIGILFGRFSIHPLIMCDNKMPPINAMRKMFFFLSKIETLMLLLQLKMVFKRDCSGKPLISTSCSLFFVEKKKGLKADFPFYIIAGHAKDEQKGKEKKQVTLK